MKCKNKFKIHKKIKNLNQSYQIYIQHLQKRIKLKLNLLLNKMKMKNFKE